MIMQARMAMAGLVSVLALAGLWHVSRAEDKPADKSAPGANLLNLPAALKATPGCLGIELARTQGGKNVIFAWFENKKAALKWYYSGVHQKAMHQAFPNAVVEEPMQNVPDDAGPILAIASITPAAKPLSKDIGMAFSQIAIELYQPLPGGAALGGRFAPASVKVPKMHLYSPGDTEGKEKTKN
jgi:quinol monooxygenase YgiN